jgi:hypothetical protein
MRKLILLILIFASGFYSSSFAVGAEMCMPAAYKETQGDDGPIDPWPFGKNKELDFPWRGIQGTWTAQVDGCVTYFSFKTVRDAKGERVLNIHQFDPLTCEVISKGLGYEMNRIVRARMSTGSASTFGLRIHVFNRADVKINNKSSAPRTLYVMSMAAGGAAKNVQLVRLTNDPYSECEIKK